MCAGCGAYEVRRIRTTRCVRAPIRSVRVDVERRVVSRVAVWVERSTADHAARQA